MTFLRDSWLATVPATAAELYLLELSDQQTSITRRRLHLITPNPTDKTDNHFNRMEPGMARWNSPDDHPNSPTLSAA
jgi:hypothetical protein